MVCDYYVFIPDWTTQCIHKASEGSTGKFVWVGAVLIKSTDTLGIVRVLPGSSRYPSGLVGDCSPISQMAKLRLNRVSCDAPDHRAKRSRAMAQTWASQLKFCALDRKSGRTWRMGQLCRDRTGPSWKAHWLRERGYKGNNSLSSIHPRYCS